jgi:hypothetical protein
MACDLHLDADPDPAYQFHTDPDPAFPFDVDPGPPHLQVRLEIICVNTLRLHLNFITFMFFITNAYVVFQGYISTGAVFPSFVRCPCSTRKPLVRLSFYTAFVVVFVDYESTYS